MCRGRALIGTPLGEALGGTAIIEKPRRARGGNIRHHGGDARALPDGYTLLVCSSAFVVNPSLYAQAAYDPFKDFEPIMTLGASPKRRHGAGSIRDQVPARVHPPRAKAKPRQAQLDEPRAPERRPYLAGEGHQAAHTGITMEHIPFAGRPEPATTAVLGGQVDMYTANIGSVQPR